MVLDKDKIGEKKEGAQDNCLLQEKSFFEYSSNSNKSIGKLFSSERTCYEKKYIEIFIKNTSIYKINSTNVSDENNYIQYTENNVDLIIRELLSVNDVVERLYLLMIHLDKLFSNRDYRSAILLITILSEDRFGDRYLKSMLVITKNFIENVQVKEIYNNCLGKLKFYRKVY